MRNPLQPFALAAAALVAACQTVPQPDARLATPSEAALLQQQPRCSGGRTQVDAAFIAGAFADCEFLAPNHVALTIEPEDEPPINCSAWYAFRVSPHRAGALYVDLNYDVCGHRYQPKISTDGANWQPLPDGAVLLYERDGVTQARLTLPPSDTSLFVAGQELIVPADYDAWLDALANRPEVSRWTLGQSAEGRTIPAATIVAPGSAPLEQIVLIGRQHPPELTGYFALHAFVDTILEDNQLARDFRTRFQVTLVPMLNPDGVVRGHWRHSTGGLDLNRDWGPFTQPETQLMDQLLTAMAADPARDLQLFIDFHSTNRDIFYTIPDEDVTDPARFTSDWLGLLATRMPDYTINRDSNHNPGSATSKGHVFTTYGAPTVTFEVGDETDREFIKQLGREAALAMMEVMLKSPRPQPPVPN